MGDLLFFVYIYHTTAEYRQNDFQSSYVERIASFLVIHVI